MKKFFSVCATLAIFASSQVFAAAPCAEDDLECLHRLLDAKNTEIQSLQRELGLTNELVKTKTEENAVLTESNKALAGTLETVKPALQAGQRAWYEDSRLWYGAGVLTGVLLVVLTAVTVNAALAK